MTSKPRATRSERQTQHPLEGESSQAMPFMEIPIWKPVGEYSEEEEAHLTAMKNTFFDYENAEGEWIKTSLFDYLKLTEEVIREGPRPIRFSFDGCSTREEIYIHSEHIKQERGLDEFTVFSCPAGMEGCNFHTGKAGKDTARNNLDKHLCSKADIEAKLLEEGTYPNGKPLDERSVVHPSLDFLVQVGIYWKEPSQNVWREKLICGGHKLSAANPREADLMTRYRGEAPKPAGKGKGDKDAKKGKSGKGADGEEDGEEDEEEEEKGREPPAGKKGQEKASSKEKGKGRGGEAGRKEKTWHPEGEGDQWEPYDAWAGAAAEETESQGRGGWRQHKKAADQPWKKSKKEPEHEQKWGGGGGWKEPESGDGPADAEIWRQQKEAWRAAKDQWFKFKAAQDKKGAEANVGSHPKWKRETW